MIHPSVSWWSALNAPIYLISILPGIGVWLLVRPPDVKSVALIVATLAVVLLQHAINVLNDAADWRLGADVDKADSWVRVHAEDMSLVLKHGWVSFTAGSLVGTLALAWTDRLWILALALPLVALGYLYNSGPRPLSYTRLGEWVTGICYGPGVFGCLWLVTGAPTGLMTIMGCIAFGALAVALLLSHQPPQIRTDQSAGKRSFAVRYGAALTLRTARLLFLVYLTTWLFAMSQVPAMATSLPLWLGLAASAFAGTFTDRLGPRYLLFSATSLMIAQGLLRS